MINTGLQCRGQALQRISLQVSVSQTPPEATGAEEEENWTRESASSNFGNEKSGSQTTVGGTTQSVGITRHTATGAQPHKCPMGDK